MLGLAFCIGELNLLSAHYRIIACLVKRLAQLATQANANFLKPPSKAALSQVVPTDHGLER